MMTSTRRKIVLHTGDHCFEREDACLHTLLGSCVSITMWHPRLRIGGMCHFALPRPQARAEGSGPDPRYAEDCLELFGRTRSAR